MYFGGVQEWSSLKLGTISNEIHVQKKQADFEPVLVAHEALPNVPEGELLKTPIADLLDQNVFTPAQVEQIKTLADSALKDQRDTAEVIEKDLLQIGESAMAVAKAAEAVAMAIGTGIEMVFHFFAAVMARIPKL